MAEWYNTAKMERYAKDANICFIVGARRIGKTLHFQKKAFELWENQRLQTMWVRNKKIELEDGAFIADFLNAPKAFGWSPEGCVTKKEGVYNAAGEQIIKFQSISTFSNRRGNMTDQVGMIVFDEFMPEDRKYPRHAHLGLLSLTKTVLSGRPTAKCYCLSNFISAANPYFVGFGIYPDDKYDVTYFKDKGVAIEVCRGYRSAIESDNPWNRVYRAGNYQDYADRNEDSLFTLIKPLPKAGRLHPWFILSGGKTYGAMVKDGLIYWHETEPNTRTVWAATLQESTDTIYQVPKFFLKILKEKADQGVLRFTDPNVMYAILSLIYETV